MKQIYVVFFFSLSFMGSFAQTASNENPEELLTPKTSISNKYKLSYSLEYYEAMIQKCQLLAVKLVGHDEAMKEGAMNPVRLKQWKQDLTEAQLLNYQINDYMSMYERKNFALKERVKENLLNDYQHFSKVIDSAKQYAGW